MDIASAIIESRKNLTSGLPPALPGKPAEEGGCGVVGFASSVPVRGRHIFEPSVQMHNRGNGKGGGVACACLDAAQLGVDEATLRDSYILQVALLEPEAAAEVEAESVLPHFDVRHKTVVTPAADWRELGLPVRPSDIVRYFVRAKTEALARFSGTNGFAELTARAREDEFVYQNSFRLNQRFYASLGTKRAFVLSHARDLMIFKVVGYAEHVVQYYGLEDLRARVWIAHQRYPTKGRVWHPGGAHPFIGMNEALVHNGDFANYYGVTEYLRQHHIIPQFLTDTEVSVQLFDLWTRVYGYPLEYVIEGLAPTTELDFDRLPEDKQRAYRQVQRLHKHCAPDGPWFFIIARSQPDEGRYSLLGITDTAMLRPQVFALQEGEASIGLIASEKQAIDATLRAISAEDPRFRPVADRYWNARGGSHTDGGAFNFTIARNGGPVSLTCRDKFGKPVLTPPGEYRIAGDTSTPVVPDAALLDKVREAPAAAFEEITSLAASWDFAGWRRLLGELETLACRDDGARESVLELLTRLNDRRFNPGALRRSALLCLIRRSLDAVLDKAAPIDAGGASRFARTGWDNRHGLRPPREGERVMVIHARDFPPEGDDCDARLAVAAYKLGWRRFIVYGLKGQRFHGCGFGPDTDGARMDIYGSSGDYLASGIDGMEIHVHDSAQDQLAQIMKQGRLVIYGDVGQAFMYGAKGGEVYVMGNAAGRPLINAVGRPRVVINGTCLDFLAESFMAGDPDNGGGFVILNGIEFDDAGRVREQPAPYPGANLFSLASGGAIFVRDPHGMLVREQLNGGEFYPLTGTDWRLILPYLEENERLFGISVDSDLLSVNGQRRSPGEVYRKVAVKALSRAG
ncbi:MAG: glutamate synthase [Chloroflexi bacterium]|nr:glutamate synthase [Chloroflexota bacterium]